MSHSRVGGDGDKIGGGVCVCEREREREREERERERERRVRKYLPKAILRQRRSKRIDQKPKHQINHKES